MRRLITLIFSSLVFAACTNSRYDADAISAKTQGIVSAMANENRLVNESIGLGGERTEQFDRFEKLNRVASRQELITLTDHPNGVVRAYAFWALALRYDPEIFSIVKQHITDEAFIRTEFGCVNFDDKVGDFFISLITQEYPEPKAKKLGLKQRKVLDSLLIWTPNHLYARDRAVAGAEPTPELYLRMRSLYVKEKNQAALTLLSKYRREQDIGLILQNQDTAALESRRYAHTYAAIANFPRPEFFQLLRKKTYQDGGPSAFSEDGTNLCKAIVAYKNNEAIALLNVLFRDTPTARKTTILYAILENYDPIYNRYLWSIAESDYEISSDVLRFCVSNDPERAYRMVLKKLGITAQHRTEKPKFNETMFVYDIHQSMLNFVRLNDEKLAESLTRN
jgi:hypothetical protein